MVPTPCLEADPIQAVLSTRCRMGLENEYFLISAEAETTKLEPASAGAGTNARDVVDGKRRLAVKEEDRGPNHGAFIMDFLRQSMLLTSNPTLSSKSLVISQPRSKNGPLGNIDYGIGNDFTEGTGKSAPVSSPATTGGSY